MTHHRWNSYAIRLFGVEKQVFVFLSFFSPLSHPPTPTSSFLFLLCSKFFLYFPLCNSVKISFPLLSWFLFSFYCRIKVKSYAYWKERRKKKLNWKRDYFIKSELNQDWEKWKSFLWLPADAWMSWEKALWFLLPFPSPPLFSHRHLGPRATKNISEAKYPSAAKKKYYRIRKIKIWFSFAAPEKKNFRKALINKQEI